MNGLEEFVQNINKIGDAYIAAAVACAIMFVLLVAWTLKKN